MKQVNTVLIVILLVVLTGYGKNRQSNDGLVIMNVSRSYPKKELILQSSTNVGYVALETTDGFLIRGLVQDVGKEYLLVANKNNDGDVFIFDRRTDKGLKKTNRRGQGTEEYARISEIVLDEGNDEIFIKSPGDKILMYDLNGGFKRYSDLGKDISPIFNCNKHSLFCYDMSDYHNKGKDKNKSYHILMSKQDGSITREILIPFKTIDTLIVTDGDRLIANYSYQVRLSSGKWTFMDASADTLYSYAPDGILNPFVVRTPSANTTEPKVFPYMGIHTDRYYSMGTVKNIFNFKRGNGFYTDELAYDKKEKIIF